jgi:hypothetical protein
VRDKPCSSSSRRFCSTRYGSISSGSAPSGTSLAFGGGSLVTIRESEVFTASSIAVSSGTTGAGMTVSRVVCAVSRTPALVVSPVSTCEVSRDSNVTASRTGAVFVAGAFSVSATGPRALLSSLAALLSVLTGGLRVSACT